MMWIREGIWIALIRPGNIQWYSVWTFLFSPQVTAEKPQALCVSHSTVSQAPNPTAEAEWKVSMSACLTSTHRKREKEKNREREKGTAEEERGGQLSGPSVAFCGFGLGRFLKTLFHTQGLQLLRRVCFTPARGRMGGTVVYKHVWDVLTKVDLAVCSNGLVFHQIQILGCQLQLWRRETVMW